MKKITIDKEEGIAEIIEQVVGEGDDEIIIVIPKGSLLGRSAANFRLLKHEMEAAGKDVTIESVDEEVLSLARESGIDASHPLWRGVRRGVSDIVPAEKGGENELGSKIEAGHHPASTRSPGHSAKSKSHSEPAAEEHSKESSAAKHHKKDDPEPVKLFVKADDKEDGENDGEEYDEAYDAARGKGDKDEMGEFEEKEDRFFDDFDREDDGDDDKKHRRGKKRSRKRVWAWVAGIVVIIIVAFWVTAHFFGHAVIAVDFQKTPWTYSGNFIADKSAGTADATAGVIPAQIFTAEKNTTELFPASGSSTVSLKAQGTITIVNDYSSKPQDLVKTTRFLTSDGKLFRLVSDVTVPGATVASNGSITPSSIDAQVVADQAGPDYNVGPVDKLSIPGFKGTAKYDGFYGVLKSGTSGGFIGPRAVPTAADISAAKTKTTEALQTALATYIAASFPNHFKILDGATDVTVNKLTVNTTTDDNGNFSVFGDADITAIGFDEQAFDGVLLSLAETQTNEPSSTFKNIDLSYGSVHADFSKGTVSFTINATGTLEHAFSSDDFKSLIGGESVGNARQAIASLPGLSNGTLSVWPGWLGSVPTDPNRISIDIN